MPKPVFMRLAAQLPCVPMRTSRRLAIVHRLATKKLSLIDFAARAPSRRHRKSARIDDSHCEKIFFVRCENRALKARFAQNCAKFRSRFAAHDARESTLHTATDTQKRSRSTTVLDRVQRFDRLARTCAEMPQTKNPAVAGFVRSAIYRAQCSSLSISSEYASGSSSSSCSSARLLGLTTKIQPSP